MIEPRLGCVLTFHVIIGFCPQCRGVRDAEVVRAVEFWLLSQRAVMDEAIRMQSN